jgi:hypothetical protein
MSGGTMMMNDQQVDLSLEENQHIKPSYTYSQLISQAILESPDEQRTLNEIYNYCKKNYAFFRRPEHEKGWQVSFPSFTRCAVTKHHRTRFVTTYLSTMASSSGHVRATSLVKEAIGALSLIDVKA